MSVKLDLHMIVLLTMGIIFYLVSYPATQVSAIDREDGTSVAHWTFDERTGDHVIDVTGNGNNGTIYGAEWSDGIGGSSLLFDENEDRVTIPDSDILDISGSISIEVWFNAFDLHGDGSHDGAILVCKYVDVPVGQYAISLFDGGGLRFWLAGDDVGSDISRGSVVTTQKWHYVVGTWDTEIMNLYVDGAKIAAEATPFHRLRTDEYQNDDLTIGHHSFSTWPFRGLIDDVIIRDRCLNDSEIAQTYIEMTEEYPEIEITDDPVDHSLDSDHDYLPDRWELDHFGTIYFGPDDDNDDDGYVNLQEFMDGTDPNDPVDQCQNSSIYERWFILLIVVNCILVIVAIAVPIMLFYLTRGPPNDGIHQIGRSSFERRPR